MNATQPQSRIRHFYLLLLAGALVFYLLSMAPGALWQDSGLIQVRVLQRDLYGHFGLALSHPLYYLVAFAFQSLPFGTSAFKTNLVSVVFGALTVANVGLLLRLATGRRTGAIIGAVALAVAHTFWQHCALAETYTLTTALLSVELLCLQQYDRTRVSGWLLLLMVVNGFSVNNHLLAGLSFACYGTLLLVLAMRRQISAGFLLLALVCWTCAGGLYWGMVLQQLAHGGGLPETLRSAFFGEYGRNVMNLTVGRRELVNTVMYLGLNFPTPLVLLLPLGLSSLRLPERRLFGTTLTALLVVHLLYAMRYNIADQYTFFIPTVMLLAITLGLSADRFLTRRPNWRCVLVVAAALPIAVYVPLPQVARAAGLKLGVGRHFAFRDDYAWFLHPYKTGEHGPERFAAYLIEQLPAGAVLIADGTTVRPLHYFALTGRWRSDVTVYPVLNKPGLAPWDPSEQQLSEALARGCVYVVTPKEGYCPAWLVDGYKIEPAGPIFKVVGPQSSTTTTSHSPG